jgi:hypothetical protein
LEVFFPVGVVEVVGPLVDELLWAVECDGVFCEFYCGVGLVGFLFAVWCGVVEDEVVVHGVLLLFCAVLLRLLGFVGGGFLGLRSQFWFCSVSQFWVCGLRSQLAFCSFSSMLRGGLLGLGVFMV